MNGYERIQAALVGRRTDCTPVMLHNFMMAAYEAGYSMAEFRNDPRKIAESFIRAIETYNYDGILVDIDTVTLAGAVGVPVDFPVDSPARSVIGYLASLDDLEKLQRVDIGKYKYVQIWLEAVSLLKSHFKSEIYIRGNCDQAPFSLASMMRTPQEWFMDLIVNEEQALILLDYCTEATCQFIELMSETGADMLSNGDSPAGPEMISPEMYTRFALPYEKRVIEKAHQCGLPYALHICGNTDIILEQMIESGADAFELDQKTDARKAHEILGGKTTFIGNVDPSAVLTHGSVDEVKQKTEEIMAIFADTPRFILNAGCAIPPTAPSANIYAMIKTARQHTAS
ncbi:MAG: uroporphyrinogen decarboxylase family protein [Candidatus Marinimicrobia bacterium]|nr:uroporphyrinogen decarboxylase family protein [Candidatus Neomarinimicrobiota bacterium]